MILAVRFAAKARSKRGHHRRGSSDIGTEGGQGGLHASRHSHKLGATEGLANFAGVDSVSATEECIPEDDAQLEGHKTNLQRILSFSSVVGLVEDSELGGLVAKKLRLHREVWHKLSAQYHQYWPSNSEGNHRPDVTINYANASEVAMSPRARKQGAGETLESRYEENTLPAYSPKFMCHPQSIRKVKWDLWVALLIIYSCITVPLRIGFDLEASVAGGTVDALVDIMFFIDIVVNFCTAYLDDDGEVVTDRRLIARRYLRGWFWLDLISTLPFGLMLAATGSKALLRSTKLLRVLRLLRLARLLKLSKIMQSNEGSLLETIHPSFWALSKMMICLFFISHIMGCMWHGLYVLASPNTITWVTYYGIQDTSVSHRYLVSVYWAFTTMTTVGYGDVNTSNNLERGFAVLSMIVGASVFGYIIGNVTVIVENFNVEEAIEREKMDEVNEWLSDRKFPPSLSSRIRKQYKYVFKQSNVFDAREILAGLPILSATAVMYSQYARTIESSPFLRDAPPQFLSQVLQELKPCYVSKGEALFLQGQIATHCFLLREPLKAGRRGSMGAEPAGRELDVTLGGADALPPVRFFVCLNPSKKSSGIKEMICPREGYGDSRIFGHGAVLLNVLHPFSAVAARKTELCTLTKEALTQLLADWPHIEEDMRKSATAWFAEAEGCMESLHTTGLKLDSVKAFRHALSSKQRPTSHKRVTSIDSVLTTGPVETLESCRNGDDNPKGWEKLSVGTLKEAGLLGTGGVERVQTPVGKKASKGSSPAKSLRDATVNALRVEDAAIELVPEVDGKASAEALQARLAKLPPSQLVYETGLLHPDSAVKMSWDIFMSVLIIWSVLEVSFRLGFNAPAEGGWFVWNVMIDCMFFMDMVASFNTAYFAVDESLVVNRKMAAIHYLKGWFAIDFISTVPLDLILSAIVQNSTAVRSAKLARAFRLARLFKLLRLLKMSAFFQEHEQAMPMGQSGVRITKLLVLTMFSAHLIACMLYGVGLSNVNSGRGSWITDYCTDDGVHSQCLSDLELASHYLASVYFSFTTMTTVGYGDISPNPLSAFEIAIVLMTEVIGTTVFAWVIGTMVNLVLNLDPVERNRKQLVGYLDEYLRNVPMTYTDKKAVKRHYEHSLQIRSVFKQQALLDGLPPHLTGHAQVFLSRSYLQQLPFICSMERHMPGFLQVVMPHLTPAMYKSDDVLVSKTMGAREMTFITSGIVATSVALGRNRIERGEMREGSHFNEAMILLPSHVPLKAVAHVTAKTAVQAMHFRSSSMSAIKDCHPHVSDFIIKQLYNPVDSFLWVVVSDDYAAELAEVKEIASSSNAEICYSPRSAGSPRSVGSLRSVGSPRSADTLETPDPSPTPLQSARSPATKPQDLRIDTGNGPQWPT